MKVNLLLHKIHQIFMTITVPFSPSWTLDLLHTHVNTVVHSSGMRSVLTDVGTHHHHHITNVAEKAVSFYLHISHLQSHYIAY
ncbi:unnamed protein product [Urochloa humidicola]